MRPARLRIPERLGVVHIIFATALIFGVSFLLAYFNYLLAHALVEGLAIVVALFVYVFASRTRKYTRDDYLLLLGYGCLSVAILDFFHLLTYQGSGIFPLLSSANATTQFWVAARFVQAFSLLIAPFAAKRRFRAKIVLPVYLLAAMTAFISIMILDTFPTCYIEGIGLTPVKIFSECLICAILVGAIWLTWDYSEVIGSSVATLVILSISMAIISECFATVYSDIYGPASLMAHACKGVSFYLIFHGTVAEGLDRPFRQVDRARKQLGDKLRFEALLTELSTELSSLTLLSDVRDELRSGLARLVDLLQTDRALILETHEGDMRFIEMYRRDGPDIPVSYLDRPGFKWIASQIAKGGAVIRTGLPNSFPPEAIAERKFCESEGIAGCALVPCSVGNQHVIAVGLCTYDPMHTWNEDTIQRLKLAGEMFVNALNRARANEEASRLRVELNHFGRVTTMGQLAAALAHEINQPLTAILSNAQVGLRYLEMPELDKQELNEILKDIVSDNRRATEVINRIRALMRKGKLNMKPARLSHLALELLSILDHLLAERGVLVETNFPGPEPLVSVDPTQIHQVMLNLLMNGVEAMENTPLERRRLQITTHCATKDHPGIRFSVTDCGSGISTEEQNNIFEPFVTNKKNGLGMGLAITRGIVEAHGGRIWVESSLGKQTTFTFEMPLAGAKGSGVV